MNRMWIGAAVIAASSFVSLSYEVVWYRLAGFAASSTAAAFPLLLGTYLLGIAFGSLGADFVVARKIPVFRAAGLAMLVSAVFGALAGAGFAELLVLGAGYYVALGVFAVAATGLGFLFPLLSHWAVPPDDRAGARVSYLYASNIVGSVAGTILTGFVLLDVLDLVQLTALLSTVSVLLYLIIAWRSGGSRAMTVGVTAVTIAALWLGLGALYDGIWSKLFYWEHSDDRERFAEVHEGRGGVVVITPGERALSGGVYDGTFSVDLVDDSNGIGRAFVGPLLHPDPKRVLCIGLATGSWATVLASAPGVEEVVLLEIQTLWPRVIETRSPQKNLFDDPKVTWVYDDARRWLNANPDEEFDLVVANVSYHWRSHSSLLLSEEFQQLVSRHLSEDGMYIFNTTDSAHVWATTLEVFPHVWRFYNAAVASKAPLVVRESDWKSRLDRWSIYGTPVFTADPVDQAARQAFLELGRALDQGASGPDGLVETQPSLQQRYGDAGVITDDNMGDEWLWSVVPRTYWLRDDARKVNRWDSE